jgi:hypothetical protein
MHQYSKQKKANESLARILIADKMKNGGFCTFIA